MGMGLELEVLELSFHAHGRELRSHLIPGEKKKSLHGRGRRWKSRKKLGGFFWGRIAPWHLQYSSSTADSQGEKIKKIPGKWGGNSRNKGG